MGNPISSNNFRRGYCIITCPSNCKHIFWNSRQVRIKFSNYRLKIRNPTYATRPRDHRITCSFGRFWFTPNQRNPSTLRNSNRLEESLGHSWFTWQRSQRSIWFRRQSMGRCRDVWTGSLSASRRGNYSIQTMDSHTSMGCLLVIHRFGFTIAFQWNIEWSNCPW